jgi:di/tricarboxylate transporter|tara:strand:- start:187 stop:2046 length:1860 start_codon:yes stop_codon:yes gene_type:complete
MYNPLKYENILPTMMPDLPSIHALAVMGLTAVGLYMFSRDWIPIETTGLVILATIVSLFFIFPYNFNGNPINPITFFIGSFGNEALITICLLLAVGKAIEINHSLQPLIGFLSTSWLTYPKLSLLAVLLFGAFFSAFINNTPIVVMLIPALIAVSKKAEISSSKILMPMGMATLIGGMSTTIGTSTNLLVVGIANDMGLETIQLFDFVLPAVIAGSIGMMFLWLVAPRLLPNDPPRSTKESTRIFEAALYVDADGFTDGKTLVEIQEKAGNDFIIEKIKRSDSLFVAKIPSIMFEAGDRIYVNDTLENLQEYQQLLGLSLFEEEVAEEAETEIGSEVQLAEVVITSGSFLDHTSLNAQHFSSRFNLLPIAVHSGSTGIELKGEIAAKTLTPGDVILVQGSLEAIENLKTNSNMLVIENEDLDLGTKRSFIPLYIMVGVAGLAASNLLPISIAAMLGLIGMLVFRLMKWSDVGNAMNIPIIMLIVASLSLGNALVITGGSDYLAELFVYATSSMSVALILSTLMLLMAVLTNIVSNNAAAVIGTPIAINIAQQLGASPEPFVLAVLFGANMSFVTPIGYKTNLLIMGAGGYKFNDFVKVGLPLAFIMWVAFSIILPVLYL